MASQKKSHVFRVTGLSRDEADGDLKTALQEVIDDSFTDDERSQIKAEITIVPSCYESGTQRAALVHFRGAVPQFLHELRVDPLGDWQVEMGDDDINFDCHFFGFTQLYTPDEKQSTVAESELIPITHNLKRETNASYEIVLSPLQDWMVTRMAHGRAKETSVGCGYATSYRRIFHSAAR
jgi:hypothetical protein